MNKAMYQLGTLCRKGQTLLQSPRISSALYIWTMIHAGLLVFGFELSQGIPVKQGLIFWPFTDLAPYLQGLMFYDLSEFYIYVAVPWLLFVRFRETLPS